MSYGPPTEFAADGSRRVTMVNGSPGDSRRGGVKRSTLLALGCLLLGFGAGYVAPSLKQKPLASSATVIKSGSGPQVGFARNACAGRPIPRVDGGWAVVYGDDEC